MIRFIALRTVQALVVLALMSVAIYGLIGLMPGDPIDEMIAANPKLGWSISAASPASRCRPSGWR
jgi:peptide/nickel transport system permease protein